MIKAKTSIKLLRSLGFALIALPEPITTPFGVALVIASRFLSKRLEARVNKQLQNTLTNYLIHFNRFSEDADSKSNFPAKVKRYANPKEPLITWQYHWGGNRKPNYGPLVWQSRHDIPDDIVHHAIDMQTLHQRFGSNDDTVIENDLSNSSGSGQAIHHTMNMERLSRRFRANDESKTGAALSNTSRHGEEAIHHEVNNERLCRRFGISDAYNIKPGSSNPSGNPEETIHHAVNNERLSRRFGNEDGVASDSYRSEITVKHHAVNMPSLLRRFGTETSSTPTLKAR